MTRADAPRGPRMLIVDDDVELCELLVLRFEARAFSVAQVHDAEAALEHVERQPLDVVLLDLRLGDESGLDVLERVRERAPELSVIVLTAHGSVMTAVSAMRAGAFGFLLKPFADHELVQQVEHAVENTRLKREIVGLRRLVSGESGETPMIGVSHGIEEVRDLTARLAPTDATVLVLGESGTGKELVARLLHQLSPRRTGPFVAVNCAALTSTLLESTLFGHVRGAFTGASTDRQGLFGAAHGGTLFLDEIGEASIEVQAKLLRVLETRRYTPVGATNEDETDARIVAATNRDLRHEANERRFREDLFYRLNVVPITMPPLRERTADIPLLAHLFVERASARHGRSAPRIGAEALAALSSHAWPGNVRELANVMEAAVLLTRADEVSIEDLPGISTAERATRSSSSTTEAAFARSIGALWSPFEADPDSPLPSLRAARDAFERAYLVAVLRRAGGNVSLVARLSGRNRTDLYDLFRRHDLRPSDFK